MRERIKRLIRRWPIAESAARFLVDRRYRMARKYLRGIGMEIGALDRPLILPKSAKAYYLDRMPLAELRRHYAEHSHKPFFISLIGDGEKLDCIRDGALDFIVANHMIEHCQDPIGTLKTFLSKLRVGGRIFMAVPDMRRTFDRDREPTTWDHLFHDHRNGPQMSRHEHYLQWAELVNHVDPEAIERRAAELEAMDYSIHFHCWTMDGFRDFLDRCRSLLPLRVVGAVGYRNENIFIINKIDAAA